MTTPYLHSYLPNTPDQRREMLQAIGVDSVEDLFADIPTQFRDPPLNLPPALTEQELRQEMEALARQNVVPGDYSCFRGGGVYRHFIPSVVKALLSRGELLTAYTPYQPEVSQGTLQATYDFQSLVCLLTGMEVANAGMYEGATALAEAALMACRITGRYKVTVLDTVNPRYQEVLNTYTLPQGVQVVPISPGEVEVGQDTACLVLQYPDFLGRVEDLEPYANAAHRQGALLVVSTYPTALGLFKPPGDYGADIVTGENQPLGTSLSFGGAYVGLFACRERYLRQMPGRVVGKTEDGTGRPGFVLTLQTREQHIRRERATSNICTSEALVATGVAIYLAALGPQGLRQVAQLCYQKAHYAASLIGQIPGYSVVPGGIEAGAASQETAAVANSPKGPSSGRVQGSSSWFNEFVVHCPVAPRELNRRLLEQGIIGGLDVSDQIPNGMLLCVTETNARAEIDTLAQALNEFR